MRPSARIAAGYSTGRVRARTVEQSTAAPYRVRSRIVKRIRRPSSAVPYPEFAASGRHASGLRTRLIFGTIASHPAVHPGRV